MSVLFILSSSALVLLWERLWGSAHGASKVVRSPGGTGWGARGGFLPACCACQRKSKSCSLLDDTGGVSLCPSLLCSEDLGKACSLLPAPHQIRCKRRCSLKRSLWAFCPCVTDVHWVSISSTACCRCLFSLDVLVQWYTLASSHTHRPLWCERGWRASSPCSHLGSCFFGSNYHTSAFLGTGPGTFWAKAAALPPGS